MNDLQNLFTPCERPQHCEKQRQYIRKGFFQAGVYGGVKNRDFRPISHFISQPVEAMAIVTIEDRRHHLLPKNAVQMNN